NCAKYHDSPSRPAPWPRTESPSGASTLMTSAPISPSRAVQNGPDRTRVRSRTFIPVSGIDISHHSGAHSPTNTPLCEDAVHPVSFPSHQVVFLPEICHSV